MAGTRPIKALSGCATGASCSSRGYGSTRWGRSRPVADYSEDWSCSCGAADLRRIDSHKWDCKVPEKLAKSRQEERLKQQAKEQQHAEQYAQWDSLGDEDLMEQMQSVRKMSNAQAKIARALENDWLVGREVLVKRGLMNRYLNRIRV